MKFESIKKKLTAYRIFASDHQNQSIQSSENSASAGNLSKKMIKGSNKIFPVVQSDPEPSQSATNDPEKNDVYGDEKKREKTKSSKEQVKDYAFECVQRSSIHGIPNLTSSSVHLIVKFVWAFLCLFSWAYFIYTMVALITYYNKFETNTAISILFESPSDFPAVTICNLNPFDGLQTRDDMDNVTLNRDLYLNNSDSVRDFVDLAMSQYKAYYKDKIDKNDSWNPYQDGFTMREMLISCEYQGKKCNESDFYWFRDYNYGNCYRFNGNDASQNGDGNTSHKFVSYSIKKSSVPGWRYGLRLELYTGDQQTQQQYTFKVFCLYKVLYII